MMEQDNEPKLFGVLHSEIDTVWLEVRGLIKAALEYSDQSYKIHDILEGIKSRDLQLWGANRGGKITSVMVTKIIKYPQKKSLLMMLYAGEHTKNMTQFLPTIYEWAKEQGCVDAQMYGRSGWEKVLKDQGYEKVYSVLRLKL